MSDREIEGTSVRRAASAIVTLLCVVGLTACKKDGPNPPPTPVGPGSTPEPSISPGPLSTTPPPPPPADAGVLAGTCEAVTSRAALERKPRNRSGEPRIVGGRPSTSPFAVAITTNGTQAGQYCGGSLVGPDTVLTAAHCQVGTSDKVIVGRSDLTATSTGTVVGIREVKNHARYDQGTHDNDIAILKLVEPVSSAPLAVYQGPGNLAGDKALVVGWGYTTEGGTTSPKLMEVEVPVITNTACDAGYAADGVRITGNMMCAGLSGGGKDSCQGDSGGPLVVKKVDGTFEQAGIVSFGIGCARPGKYGVYTRVSNFADWIEACSR